MLKTTKLKVAEPEVTLLAATDLRIGLSDLGMDEDPAASGGESLMEFAGRACYQSFHKPNEYTRANKDYLANIIRQQHESVLEHASATFYIEGVSRAFTHELVRHRHFSYSQLSQRFVDESEARVVVPPALRDLNNPELTDGDFLEKYQDIVGDLSEYTDLTRKQIREAARAVLPNCLETKIVVTGNVRAWRQFLWRRLDPSADAEIQEVAWLLLEQLRKEFPSLFVDIKEWYDALYA